MKNADPRVALVRSVRRWCDDAMNGWGRWVVGAGIVTLIASGACEEDPPAGGTDSGTGGGETSTGPSSMTTGSSMTSMTTGSSMTSDGSEDGGQLPPADECESPADCVIDDDCCHCFAYAELPATHECELDGICEATECVEMFSGLAPELACVDGNCRFAKIDCDPAHAACDAPPPECRPGTLAAVVDGCWGPCIRNHLCSGFLYPGATCPADTFELRWSECAGDACGSATACEPIPEACGGEPSCACGIEAICAEYDYACHDDTTGPFCCSGDQSTCSAAG